MFSVIGGIWTVAYAVFNVLPDVHKEGKEVTEMEKELLSQPLCREKLESMWQKNEDQLS